MANIGSTSSDEKLTSKQNFKLAKEGVKRQFPKEETLMGNRNIKIFNYTSNLRSASETMVGNFCQSNYMVSNRVCAQE